MLVEELKATRQDEKKLRAQVEKMAKEMEALDTQKSVEKGVHDGLCEAMASTSEVAEQVTISIFSGTVTLIEINTCSCFPEQIYYLN